MSHDPRSYEAAVITCEPGKADMKQTTAGGAKSTAAWLRAIADEIDPPKPVMRGRLAQDAPLIPVPPPQGSPPGTSVSTDGRNTYISAPAHDDAVEMDRRNR